MTVFEGDFGGALRGGTAITPWRRTVRASLRPRAVAAAFVGLAVFSGAGWSLTAFAGPEDGTFVGGSGTITQGGARTDIHQSTARGAIDWRSFSIGVGEIVQFHQPSSSSVTLNRVTGQDPSNIFGQLQANGRVVLVNPNGVFFQPGSRVDVSGLIATTSDISNANFMAGRLEFDLPSAMADARVVNEGSIRITEAGGFAILHGYGVENRGEIIAERGTVALGASERMTVDLLGDELVTFRGTITRKADGTGEDGLVTNTGLIAANGGVVRLSADAVDGLLRTVINTTGLVQADSIGFDRGRVVMSAGGGGISIGGQVAATGGAGERGGDIIARGPELDLLTGGRLDASGDEGGSVSLFAGDRLSAQGDILARGGGEITTESLGALEIAGAPDAGEGGRWTAGAAEIEIGAGGGPVDGVSQLAAGDVSTALDRGMDVEIEASAGDLTLDGEIAKTNGDGTVSLALQAARDLIAQAESTLAATQGSLDVSGEAGRDVRLERTEIATNDGAVSLTADRDVRLTDSTIEGDTITLTADADLSGAADTDPTTTGGDAWLENSTLMARGDQAGETGGDVEVTGDRVLLAEGSRIDASGQAGGGDVKFGGDYLGGGDTRRADGAVITEDSVILANALDVGDGGRVIVWSDRFTNFSGQIEARGGVNGGAGGFVETSSKDDLQVFGGANVGAVDGEAGTWLLDPGDLIIGGAPNNNINTGGSPYFTNGAGARITIASLIFGLSTGDLVITTDNAFGGEAGDITWQDDFAFAGVPGRTLTLNAAGAININANIASAASLNLVFNSDVNTLSGAPAGDGGFTLNAANTITTNGGNVTIVVNGPTGTVALNGLINAGAGAVSATAPDQVGVRNSIQAGTGFTSVSGDFIFNALGANHRISTSTGDIDIQTTGNMLFMDSAELNTLSGNILINAGAAGNVNFDFDTGAGPVLFDAAAGSIAVSGNDIAVSGGGTPPSALTLTSANGATFTAQNDVTINETVTVNGAGDFQVLADGAVTVTNNGSIDQSGGTGTIRLVADNDSAGFENATIDGAVTAAGNANEFRISAGGDVRINDAVNAGAGAGAVNIISGAGDTFINSTVAASGSGLVTIGTTGGSDLTVNNAITIGGTSNLQLNGEVIDVNAAVTGAADVSITTTNIISSALADIDADVTGGGAVTITSHGNVEIDASVDGANIAITADSDISGAGDLVVGAATRIGTAANTTNVTIRARDFNNGGAVAGWVNGSGTLSLAPVDTTSNMRFGGGAPAFFSIGSNPMNLTGGAFAEIELGSATHTGNVFIGGNAMTLGAGGANTNVTVVTGGGGGIRLEGDIAAADGNLTFANAVTVANGAVQNANASNTVTFQAGADSGVGGAALNVTAQTIDLNSVGFGSGTTEFDVSLTANGTTIQNINGFNTANGDVILFSDDAFTTGGAFTVGSGAVSVTSNESVTIGGAITTTGNLNVASDNDGVGGEGITISAAISGADVTLDAGGADGAIVDTGAFTITGSNFVSLRGQGGIGATGAIDVEAPDLRLNTNGGTTGDIANVSISGGNTDLTAAVFDAGATGTDVTIVHANANLTISDGIEGDQIAISALDDINVNALIDGVAITMEADTDEGAIADGTINIDVGAGGAIGSVATTTGAIDLSGADIQVTNGTANWVQGATTSTLRLYSNTIGDGMLFGDLTATGVFAIREAALNAITADFATVTFGDAGSTGALTLSETITIGGVGTDIVVDAGAIRLAGDIAVNDGDLTFNDAVTVATVGVRNANATGTVTFDAGAIAGAGGAALNVTAATIDLTGDVLGDGANEFDVSLTANGTTITNINGFNTANGDVILFSNDAFTTGGAFTVGTGAVSVTSNESVTIGGAIATTGNINVASDNDGVGGEDITINAAISGADVTLDAGGADGAVLTGGAFTVTGSNFVSLRGQGGIGDGTNALAVVAGDLRLNSAGGTTADIVNISLSGGATDVTAAVLDAGATGSTVTIDHTANALTISDTLEGTTIGLTANNGIGIDAAVTAAGDVSAVAGGSITVNALTAGGAAGTTTLTADGSVTLTSTVGGGTIAITADDGATGAVGNQILVDTGGFIGVAGTTGDVTLLGGNISLNFGGNWTEGSGRLTMSSTNLGQDLTFGAAVGGEFSLGAAPAGANIGDNFTTIQYGQTGHTGEITLTGGIVVGDANVEVFADDITLASNFEANGSITFNGDLAVATGGPFTVTTTAGSGDAVIFNGAIDAAGGAAGLTVNADGAIDASGQTIGGANANALDLILNAGAAATDAVNLSGVTATVSGGSVTANATGTGGILFGGGSLTTTGAGAVNLTAGGAVDTSGSTITTVNGNIDITANDIVTLGGLASTSGDVTAATNGSITIAGAVGGGTTGNLSLTADANDDGPATENLTVNAALSAGNVTLTVGNGATGTSAVGDIVINNNIQATDAAGEVVLDTSGAGNILWSAGTVTGNTVDLRSDGNIGGAGAAIDVDTGTLEIAAGGAGDVVYVADTTGAGALSLASATNTEQLDVFNLDVSGALAVNAGVGGAAAGDGVETIALVAGGDLTFGTVTINQDDLGGGGGLTLQGANVTLPATLTVSPAAGPILVNATDAAADLTVSTALETGAFTIDLVSADDITLNAALTTSTAAGLVNITANNDVTLTGTADLSGVAGNTNITADNNTAAGGSVAIQAGANANITGGLLDINGDNVTIASAITVNAAGQQIDIDAANAVTVSTDLTANGTLAVTGGVTMNLANGASVTLRSSAGGVTVDGAGAIVADGTGGQTLTLDADGGNAVLGANVNAGQVMDIVLNAAAGHNADFNGRTITTAGGNFTATGDAIAGAGATVNTGAGNQTITANAGNVDLTGAADLDTTGAGAINITANGGAVDTSGSAITTVDGAIDITGDGITSLGGLASTNGAITATSNQTITLNDALNTNGDITLNADDDDDATGVTLTVGATVDGGNVTFNAGNGSVDMAAGGVVTATTNATVTAVNGSITQSAPGASLRADGGTLTLTAGGDIGATGDQLHIRADELVIAGPAANATDNVYVHEFGGGTGLTIASVTNVAAGGDFVALSESGLEVNTSLTGFDTIVLRADADAANASNGQGDLTFTASATALTADSAIDLLGANVTLPGTLTLTTNNAASTLTVNGTRTTADGNLTHGAALALTGTANFIANGNLDLNADIDAAGAVTVNMVTAGRSLLVGGTREIASTGGAVTVTGAGQIADNGAAGSLTLNADGGDATLAVDVAAAAANPLSIILDATTGPNGAIFSGVTVDTAGGNFNATGATVTGIGATVDTGAGAQNYTASAGAVTLTGGADLDATTGNIVISATGGAVDTTGSAITTADATTAGSVMITGDGIVTLGGITANNNGTISATTTGGDLTLADAIAVTGTAGTIALSASGSLIDGTGSATAATVNLTAGANIGSVADAITVDATTLNVDAGGAGDVVYIEDVGGAGTITLATTANTSGLNVFSLISNSGLTVNADVGAAGAGVGQIILRADGDAAPDGEGDLSIAAGVTLDQDGVGGAVTLQGANVSVDGGATFAVDGDFNAIATNDTAGVIDIDAAIAAGDQLSLQSDFNIDIAGALSAVNDADIDAGLVGAGSVIISGGVSANGIALDTPTDLTFTGTGNLTSTGGAILAVVDGTTSFAGSTDSAIIGAGGATAVELRTGGVVTGPGVADGLIRDGTATLNLTDGTADTISIALERLIQGNTATGSTTIVSAAALTLDGGAAFTAGDLGTGLSITGDSVTFAGGTNFDAAGDIAIATTAGALSFNGPAIRATGGGSDVTLNAAGAISSSGVGLDVDADGDTITIQAAAGGVGVAGAGAINVTAGSIVVNNLNGGTAETVNLITASGAATDLGATGDDLITLTATGAGAVTVTSAVTATNFTVDAGAGAVTTSGAGAITAGGDVELTSEDGGVSVDTAIAGENITLRGDDGGTAGVGDLTLGGGATLTQNNGTPNALELQGAAVDLAALASASVAGDVLITSTNGTTGAITVATAFSTAGDITINSAATLNTTVDGDLTSTGGFVDLNAAGAVTLLGDVNSNTANVSIDAGADIILGVLGAGTALVEAGTTITINTTGAVLDGNLTGTSTAGDTTLDLLAVGAITIAADGGVGASQDPNGAVDIQAASVEADSTDGGNTSGDVALYSPNAQLVVGAGGVQTNGGALFLGTGGAFDIDIDADINVAGASLTLAATGGNITQSDATANVTADTLTLIAGGANGVGTAGQTINTTVTALNISLTGGGDAYVRDVDALTLLGVNTPDSGTGGTIVNITSVGMTVQDATVLGNDITLNATTGAFIADNSTVGLTNTTDPTNVLGLTNLTSNVDVFGETVTLGGNGTQDTFFFAQNDNGGEIDIIANREMNVRNDVLARAADENQTGPGYVNLTADFSGLGGELTFTAVVAEADNVSLSGQNLDLGLGSNVDFDTDLTLVATASSDDDLLIAAGTDFSSMNGVITIRNEGVNVDAVNSTTPGILMTGGNITGANVVFRVTGAAATPGDIKLNGGNVTVNGGDATVETQTGGAIFLNATTFLANDGNISFETTTGGDIALAGGSATAIDTDASGDGFVTVDTSAAGGNIDYGGTGVATTRNAAFTTANGDILIGANTPTGAVGTGVEGDLVMTASNRVLFDADATVGSVNGTVTLNGVANGVAVANGVIATLTGDNIQLPNAAVGLQIEAGGTLNVSGGNTTVTGIVNVAAGAAGAALNVNGGTLVANNGLTVGEQATATISAGIANVTGAIAVGAGGTGGQLTLSNTGNLTGDSGLTVADNSVLALDGAGFILDVGAGNDITIGDADTDGDGGRVRRIGNVINGNAIVAANLIVTENSNITDSATNDIRLNLGGANVLMAENARVQTGENIELVTTGDLTMSGNNATIDGGNGGNVVSVSAGAVTLSGDAARIGVTSHQVGLTTTGDLVISGNTLAGNSAGVNANAGGYDLNIGGAVTLSGAGAEITGDGASNLDAAGDVTVGTATNSATIETTAGDLTMNLTGAGASSLVLNGAGTPVLFANGTLDTANTTVGAAVTAGGSLIVADTGGGNDLTLTGNAARLAGGTRFDVRVGGNIAINGNGAGVISTGLGDSTLGATGTLTIAGSSTLIQNSRVLTVSGDAGVSIDATATDTFIDGADRAVTLQSSGGDVQIDGADFLIDGGGTQALTIEGQNVNINADNFATDGTGPNDAVNITATAGDVTFTALATNFDISSAVDVNIDASASVNFNAAATGGRIRQATGVSITADNGVTISNDLAIGGAGVNALAANADVTIRAGVAAAGNLLIDGGMTIFTDGAGGTAVATLQGDAVTVGAAVDVSGRTINVIADTGDITFNAAAAGATLDGSPGGAGESITLSAANGAVAINANNVRIDAGDQTVGVGNAGDTLLIDAQSFSVAAGLTNVALAAGEGVTITADGAGGVDIQGDTSITSRNGDIFVNASAGDFAVEETARLLSSNGVTVNTSGLFTMDDDAYFEGGGVGTTILVTAGSATAASLDLGAPPATGARFQNATTQTLGFNDAGVSVVNGALENLFDDTDPALGVIATIYGSNVGGELQLTGTSTFNNIADLGVLAANDLTLTGTTALTLGNGIDLRLHADADRDNVGGDGSFVAATAAITVGDNADLSIRGADFSITSGTFNGGANSNFTLQDTDTLVIGGGGDVDAATFGALASGTFNQVVFTTIGDAATQTAGNIVLTGALGPVTTGNSNVVLRADSSATAFRQPLGGTALGSAGSVVFDDANIDINSGLSITVDGPSAFIGSASTIDMTTGGLTFLDTVSYDVNGTINMTTGSVTFTDVVGADGDPNLLFTINANDGSVFANNWHVGDQGVINVGGDLINITETLTGNSAIFRGTGGSPAGPRSIEVSTEAISGMDLVSVEVIDTGANSARMWGRVNGFGGENARLQATALLVDDPRFIINNCWKARCIGDVAPIPPLPDAPVDSASPPPEPPVQQSSVNPLDGDDLLLGEDFSGAIDEWTDAVEAASPDSAALCSLLREIGDEALADLACDMLTMSANFQTVTAEPLPADPYGGRGAELTPNLVYYEPSRQSVAVGDARDPVLNYALPIFSADQF